MLDMSQFVLDHKVRSPFPICPYRLIRSPTTSTDSHLLIDFVLLCLVLLLYFWRFSLSQGMAWHAFSEDSKDWAEFGEYVGGTLGGIVGILAFIGLLINLIYQRTQTMRTLSAKHSAKKSGSFCRPV
jgi:hypothetical protein